MYITLTFKIYSFMFYVIANVCALKKHIENINFSETVVLVWFRDTSSLYLNSRLRKHGPLAGP